MSISPPSAACYLLVLLQHVRLPLQPLLRLQLRVVVWTSDSRVTTFFYLEIRLLILDNSGNSSCVACFGRCISTPWHTSALTTRLSVMLGSFFGAGLSTWTPFILWTSPLFYVTMHVHTNYSRRIYLLYDVENSVDCLVISCASWLLPVLLLVFRWLTLSEFCQQLGRCSAHLAHSRRRGSEI